MRRVVSSVVFRRAALSPLAVSGLSNGALKASPSMIARNSVKQRFLPLISRLSTTSTSSPSSVPKSKTEEYQKKDEEVVLEKKPMGRFRELWHNYGMVFLGTYSAVYLVTLGSVFEIVTMKHISAQSAVDYLHGLGVDKYVDLTPIAKSKAGNFALAWILTKFTEPLRLAFTVTITPSLARLLGRAPPKKPKMSASGGAAKSTEGAQ